MKKIYAMAAAAFLCSNVTAQSIGVSGFESFGLTPESYDNGSSGNGDFSENMLTFTNFYDDTWGSWSGFSVSNMTDVTTAGWGNQYSAFVGSGHGSDHYAVYYPTGNIIFQTLDAYGSIDSLWVTNTTYAAISMRDGDAYAKQFGSIYAADGVTVDGTNGEDFFRLWVIGESLDGLTKDSVEVYLADYRFSDNNQDYILNSWLKVDLSNFSFDVARVNFNLESSDMGAWGMNTPSYFAIDDVHYSYTLGVEEKYLDVAIYPNPFADLLTVQGEGDQIELKELNGKTLVKCAHNGLTQLNTSYLPSGIYVLEVTSDAGSVIRKIVK
jgi:hypothetical protein